MSGPEHRRTDDQELEDFLAGQGPHHARYRAASSERPPTALDAQVLAQARAALPPRSDRLQRWRLPLSLAATLLLGIGLVSRVQREPLPPVVAPAAESAAVAAAVHTPASASPAVTAEQQAWALAQRDQAEQAVSAAAGAARAPATGALQARKALAVEQQKAETLALAPATSVAPPAAADGAAVADVLPAAPPPQAAAMAPEPRAELAADAAPAVAAAPGRALQAPPSAAAKSQRLSSALTAIAPMPEAQSRYRGDSGLVLELLPGRYRLLAANEALLLAGERLPMAGGREQLQGLGGGEGGCRLWLEPLAAEPGRLLLAGDCESGLKGEYRRLEPGP